MNLRDPNILNPKRQNGSLSLLRVPVATTTGHLMPWRIEDELKEIGANYIQAGAWRGFAVRDGNLITGQQNFSGTETARTVSEAFGRWA